MKLGPGETEAMASMVFHGLCLIPGKVLESHPCDKSGNKIIITGLRKSTLYTVLNLP